MTKPVWLPDKGFWFLEEGCLVGKMPIKLLFFLRFVVNKKREVVKKPILNQPCYDATDKFVSWLTAYVLAPPLRLKLSVQPAELQQTLC